MKKLRIFLVVPASGAAAPGSTLLHDNVVQALQGCGHSLVVFQFFEEICNANIKGREKIIDFCSYEIIRTFEKHNRQQAFDLAFCMLNNTVIRPEAIQTITDLIPTVNYTTNFHQFDLVSDISKYVTLTTYITLAARKSFDDLGVRSYWMPMAAHPELYRTSNRRERYAVFVGTAYGDRPYYMWRLLQREIDLTIFGPGWSPLSGWQRLLRDLGEPLLYCFGSNSSKLKFLSRNQRRLIIERINHEFPDRVNGALSDSDMIRAFSTSHAVINLAESRYNFDFLNPLVLRGCNFRDFEVPMSGACLFTQHSDELQHFYEPGKEVIAFHDDIELAAKLDYYASRLSELQKIAESGHRRARSEHTWQCRFEKLFERLGLG